MVKAELIKNYVDQHFKGFGPNKRQEVSRLLFEISKREHIQPDEILTQIPESPKQFSQLRDYLLHRRFPISSANGERIRYALSKLDINPELRADIDPSVRQRKPVIPRNFYVEQRLESSAFVDQLKKKYPQAHLESIKSYGEYTREHPYGVGDYNERLEKFFIVQENFDFFKRCACSKKSVYCGYHVINLGSGCAFECTYCYLQDYLNSPGIVLPGNIEDFFKAFSQYRQDIRLGSGELTDSLVFDHITEYSLQIVEFFKQYPKSLFEFKTKSDNIDLLLRAQPAGNILVSWSVSPQFLIDQVEFYTASLEQRLAAAEKCAAAGYKIAFHFDPVIYDPQWKREYEILVEEIFDRIPLKSIAWMSIGTLRMTPRLKKIIENRFPENTILDEEFSVGYDGKLRYSDQRRREIYDQILSWIKKRAPQLYVYLCMEEKSICGDCGSIPRKTKDL